MHSKLDDVALDQLFRNARSYNRWTDQPLEESIIKELYELMKLGPTSVNTSPARFIFVRSAESKQRLAACVSPGNVIKVEQAPVVVIVGMDLAFYEKMDYLWPHDPSVKNWFTNPDSARATAMRNSTLQGAYMMMAARALGLDCGPLSGFDPIKVNEQFFAGTTIESNFLCCLGYASQEALFARHPRLPFAEACQFS